MSLAFSSSFALGLRHSTFMTTRAATPTLVRRRSAPTPSTPMTPTTPTISRPIVSRPLVSRPGLSPRKTSPMTPTSPRTFKTTTTTPTSPRSIKPMSPRRKLSSTPRASAMSDAAAKVIRLNNVMVFSATYCPYCAKVKTFLKELEVEHTVWELDEMLGGDEVKSWLAETTGQRTIPNVFIKGNHIGGSSDVIDLHEAGKLRALIGQA